MEDQQADLGTLELASQMEEFGKYLDLSTKCRWEEVASAILQAAARISPWFIACRFLIPSPPSFLEVQMSFQALRQRLLELSPSLMPVHQKVLIIAVNLKISFLEKRILDI